MNQNKATLFFTLITLTIMTSVNCEISHLKYYESKHALTHVLKSLRSGQIEQMDDNYEQQCTTNNVCCLCNKNFKNTSYLELHMNLHHPILDETPQDNLLPYVFDKRVSKELRFQMCTKILALTDISKLSKFDSLFSNNIVQQNVSSKSIFQKPLTKTEIVDTCTIISYGAYHQPLWRVWIKGTLIFAFVVIFIVYYASIADDINQKYFPKKRKPRHHIN